MDQVDHGFLKKRATSLWKEAQKIHMDGDLNRAIDLYTRSIAVYPMAEAYTYRAWAYSSQKRFDEAIENCKTAISLDPDFGNPYNDIGSYLILMKKENEAVEWLERAKHATRYEPRHFPYMNLGRIYVSWGKIPQAIEEFEQALRLSPGDPICRAALAQLKTIG